MSSSDTHTPLPCPCCHSTEIENEHPDSPVYCRKCWLRAVDLERWNTRAVNSHHDLIEALREARKIIGGIDDYMKRPSRGDWGEECACCMGELLDDDRDAIAKIDAALKELGR